MRKTRFWRWYRTLPLLAMMLVCLASLVTNYAPDVLIKHFLFPVKYGTYIQESAHRHDVDEYLICAVIRSESNWNPDAHSSAGAQGLMQLMPTTAQELVDLGIVDGSQFDSSDLYDPQTNIEYGTAYLAYLEQQLQNDDEVIAAYNAGIGPVSQWRSTDGDVGLKIDYAETAAYLVRVRESRERYRELYPEGITTAN